MSDNSIAVSIRAGVIEVRISTFSKAADENLPFGLRLTCLEPISKLLEEHGDTGALLKPQEVGGVTLPADEKPPFPLEPDKETFNEPTLLIAAQVASILSLEFAGGAMKCDHVDAVVLEVIIEAVTVRARSPMRCSGLASSM